MNYRTPTPVPQQEQPQQKNPLPMIIIAILVVVCLALSFMLLLNAKPGAITAESQEEHIVPHPVTFNSDSSQLAELRDSLRNAAPASQAGFYFAAVSPEKMNVFYIGVDNPITIAVGGIDPSELVPSIAGGTMSPNGKPGSYVVRVSSGTKATINVAVKVNGATKNVASYEYRIKRVPDPVAYVGNMKGDGLMTRAELQSQSGVFARMENFDFDLAYQVVSFSLVMNVNGIYVEKKATGPGITAEMKQMLSGAKSADMAFFNQIVVKGPDGTLRKIPGVSIKVK